MFFWLQTFFCTKLEEKHYKASKKYLEHQETEQNHPKPTNRRLLKQTLEKTLQKNRLSF